MRRVTKRSLDEGRITLKVPSSKKTLLKKAAVAAQEDGIPLSALITQAIEEYLDVREEQVSELASIEKVHKGLGDEELLNRCRESLSKLKTPLSKAIGEERESR